MEHNDHLSEYFILSLRKVNTLKNSFIHDFIKTVEDLLDHGEVVNISPLSVLDLRRGEGGKAALFNVL